MFKQVTRDEFYAAMLAAGRRYVKHVRSPMIALEYYYSDATNRELGYISWELGRAPEYTIRAEG